MLERDVESQMSGLLSYLHEVTGLDVIRGDLTKESLKPVPFFLNDLYRFVRISISGHSCIAAMCRKPRPEHRPLQLASHAAAIAKALNADTFLAFTELPVYARQRLMRAGVAFVAGQQHLYLPFIALDVRARMRHAQIAGSLDRFSFPAQCVILRHLLHHAFSDQILSRLAAQLGYSAMTVSRVLAELKAHSLCQDVRDGVRKNFRFTADGEALWREALPFLRSPVKRSVWVLAGESALRQLPKAGMSALACYSMVNDDPVPSYATTVNRLRRGIDEKQFSVLEPGNDEGVRVELWGYDPLLLVREGDAAADRLSVCLSLRDDPDERVQASVVEMMKGVEWSRA